MSMATNETTTTSDGAAADSRLARARNRVYTGADAVADELERAALEIRQATLRARSGAPVEDMTAEQYLVVEVVLPAATGLMPHLNLARLVERMAQGAAIEAEIAREAVR
jgi:hypothetical protein